MKICTNCGLEQDGSRFCSFCGDNLRELSDNEKKEIKEVKEEKKEVKEEIIEDVKEPEEPMLSLEEIKAKAKEFPRKQFLGYMKRYYNIKARSEKAAIKAYAQKLKD